MIKRIVIAALVSLSVTSGFVQAGDEVDVKKLEALKKVPLVDVLECQAGDEKSLSGLQSVIQITGGKPDKKTRKAVADFEERLVYWNLILGVASEDELIAAKAGVQQRQAERKIERESMSVVDYAVFSAKRDYPCDNIFEEAK